MISKSEVGSWIKAYESRESATSMPLDDTYMSSQVSSVLQTSLTQEVGNLYEYQGHRTTKLGSLVLSFVNIETEEEKKRVIPIIEKLGNMKIRGTPKKYKSIIIAVSTVSTNN